MTEIYRSKRQLTIEAEHAHTPEDALVHVSAEATRVFGLGKSVLISCEIRKSIYTGNSWAITATFEEDA